MTSPQTSRARRTIAAAVLAAAALGGCGVNSPVQTDVQYVAGDGRPANLGDVQVRNLLIVSDGKGTGTISAGVANNGTRDEKVTFTAEGGSVTKTVAAGKSIVVQAGLAKVTGKPGDLEKLVVSTPSGGEVPVDVPVLEPTGYYSTVTPTATPRSSQ